MTPAPQILSEMGRKLPLIYRGGLGDQLPLKDADPLGRELGSGSAPCGLNNQFSR